MRIGGDITFGFCGGFRSYSLYSRCGLVLGIVCIGIAVIGGCDLDTRARRKASAEALRDAKVRIEHDATDSVAREEILSAIRSDYRFGQIYAISVVRELKSRGAFAVADLVIVLENGDHAARREAARALGTVGPGAQVAVPALVAALTDEQDVATFAARSLGAIGERASPAVPALRRAAVERPALHDTAQEAINKIEAGVDGTEGIGLLQRWPFLEFLWLKLHGRPQTTGPPATAGLVAGRGAT